MKTTNYFAVLIFFVILACGIGIAFANYGTRANTDGLYIEIISFLVALIVATSIKIADQWEKAVVLRLGRFQSLRGPGLFFIIPVVDMIPYWIDKRVITSSFTAEKTLTKDTVPVDVDAVLFWKVFDGPLKLPCGMSSARPCFQICWKGGKRSAMNCRKSSMSAPNPGASMLFLLRSRMS
jgi:hypothetical protein